MKERLDNLLVERRLADTRAQAKILIMEGKVFVNNQREDKAGSMFKDDVNIELKGVAQKYVSRGGFKLEKAIESWKIDLDNKVCMDIGSSTGGFTDCMLQNKAAKVYAIDVGTNQLAWKLRSDERVVSMEKTNIRYVTPDDIGEKIDFASVDVAFISITKFLESVRLLLSENARMVCLIKPQFEAGREQVGKKGVVKDRKVHEEVIFNLLSFAMKVGFKVLDFTFSPIKGPEGNIEYLMYIENPGDTAISEDVEVSGDTAISEDAEVSGDSAGEYAVPETIKIDGKTYNLKERIKEIVNEAHGSL